MIEIKISKNLRENTINFMNEKESRLSKNENENMYKNI
jgi:hypothetical protein